MNEEHNDQQLDAAYRRASGSEAGRPEAKTRTAILAEAAAAAHRRRPAANDSRYLLRAVAGLAVIGVGLLVWRQTDHRLPGEAPALDLPVAQDSVESAAGQAFVPDPEVQPELPPVQEPTDRVAAESAQKNEAQPAPAPPAAPAAAPDQAMVAQAQSASVAPPPPPLPSVSRRATAVDEDESDSLEEVQVTGSRVQRERRTVGPRDNVPAPAAGAASNADEPAVRAEPSADALLREYFPAQYQSSTPRRVWLVRDEDGVVLDVGELGPREQLAGQISSIRRSLNLRELSPGAVQSVPNARGQLIELTILQAR